MRVLLTSYPRSGTHYVKNVISQALGWKPLEERLEDPDKLEQAIIHSASNHLIYEHLFYERHARIVDQQRYTDLGIIVLTRHPFDRLISQLALERARGTLNPMFPKEKTAQEITHDLLLGIFPGLENFPEEIIYHTKNFVTDWIRNRSVILLKYEDITRDPMSQFSQCLEYLNIKCEKKKLEEIIINNSFEKLSNGRKRGEIDERSHYRQGLSGEWKNLFSSEEIEVLRKLYEKCLYDAGGYVI